MQHQTLKLKIYLSHYLKEIYLDLSEKTERKTTTINCILNTIEKDSGTIKIFGREMSDEDTDIREHIGVVYDGNNFPEYLTATQLASILERSIRIGTL